MTPSNCLHRQPKALKENVKGFLKNVPNVNSAWEKTSVKGAASCASPSSIQSESPGKLAIQGNSLGHQKFGITEYIVSAALLCTCLPNSVQIKDLRLQNSKLPQRAEGVIPAVLTNISNRNSRKELNDEMERIVKMKLQSK